MHVADTMHVAGSPAGTRCMRPAFYTETLKFNKKLKVRVAGDSKSTDTALCLGFKPDTR